MGRAARILLAAGVILLAAAGPALGQADRPPVIDLSRYITLDAAAQWADRNGDYLPDMPLAGTGPAIPEGIAGLWDDAIGATTPEQFLADVDPTGAGFALEETGASLTGPCGGVVISYDAEGNSLDAAVDLGDDGPPVDIYGEAAFTAANPFQVDSGGMVAYFGFTLDAPLLSAGAFHNHRWEVVIMGISADQGGDPNWDDKNRNAGIMELGEVFPFRFQAKTKVQGVFVDQWGQAELPEYTAATVGATFAGRTFCYGEGWIEFGGKGNPLFTAPGALATALALAGFSGVLFNARPALSWRA